MELVCLDTNVCIWALRGWTASSGREQNVAKARHLLDMLSDRGAEISVPAVVMAELMDGTGRSEHLSFAASIQSRFTIHSFDHLAAIEYARLTTATNAPREKQKVDRMIIATALAIKASAIYSEDDDIHTIGSHVIEVRRLPNVPPKQIPLPIV